MGRCLHILMKSNSDREKKSINAEIIAFITRRHSWLLRECDKCESVQEAMQKKTLLPSLPTEYATFTLRIFPYA